MGQEPVGRLLFRYALPAIAGFLSNAMYQLVDRILVGRGVGTDGIAAVTAAFPLSVAAMAVALLLGTGTGTRISMLLGQGDIPGAERVLGQGLRLGVISGVLLSLVVWLASEPLLLLCGSPVHLLPLATPFVRIASIGQIFLISLISMGNILRVQGRPMLGFSVMFSSNLLNGVLAAIAIFWLHWGVTGTAVATALSQMLACLAVLAAVQSRISVLRIRKQTLRRDRALARSIIGQGAPVGMTQVLASMVFLAANQGAGREGGTTGVAALGVMNTVALICMYPPLGVMQAMQPLAGYNKGAGRPDRVLAILRRTLLATTGMGVLFSFVVTLFPEAIASMFTKADAALIELVKNGLPWFVVSLTLFGVAGTTSHYLLSAQRPRRAAVFLLGRQVLAIALFLVLPPFLGFSGVYLVAPCADLPFAAVAAVFLHREFARLKKEIGQMEPQSRSFAQPV